MTDDEKRDPRYYLAAERTFLAWMRTGLSLMGFGFVVARFGLFLREIALAGAIASTVHSTGWSLWIGVVLIALGVVVSLTASYEYSRFIQFASRGETFIPRTARLAVVVSVILALLGITMAAYLIVINP